MPWMWSKQKMEELTIQERNELLRELVDGGFLERIPRSVKMRLTEKGKRELKGLEGHISGWLAEELGLDSERKKDDLE
jgi:hypothetical protein